MKNYTIEHEENLLNLGTGMYISATALTTFSFLLGLNSLFDFPNFVNPAVTILVSLMVAFAFGARSSMVDLWLTMEHNTRLVVVVFTAAFFVTCCYAPAHNSLLAGLVALHVPAALTLVSERGFARLYLLAGLTCAFGVLGWRADVATGTLAVAALLLFLTMSYETFFFRIAVQPVSTRINAWLPCWLASWRFALFAAPAWLLWRFMPSPRPFLLHRDNGPTLPRERVITNPGDFNANLMKAFLYTMLLILLLLALIAMLRYLHAKFRRKRGEMLPESIGVPVSSPQRMLRRDRARPRERGDDPLAHIVKEYERFSNGLKSEKARRAVSQTPQEFAASLRHIGALPGPIVGDITAEFSSARYTHEDPSWETAEHFSKLVDQAMQNQLEDSQD